MELKHLVQRFVYRIEPKPEGGFIARATDPTVPPLEAPTREELQQKIQAKLFAALGEAFPNLKLPVEDQQLKFDVHIERQPGGGFAVHSEQTGKPGLEPATEAKIDHYAEELLGFVDKHFPHLTQSIAAQVGSQDLKVVVNQKASVRLKSESAPGIAQGFLPTQPMPAQPMRSSDAGVQNLQLEATTIEDATFNKALTNTPITPEASGAGKILRFILTLAILAAVMYFFLYRR